MPEKVVIGNAELWHADCREVLPLLPQHDLVLTDPPYGIGYAANPIVGKGKKASNHAGKAWDDETPPAWLFGLLQEKGKHLIVWGGNYYPLPPSRGWLSWFKPDGPPSMGHFELAWTSMDMLCRQFERSIGATNAERVGHPTQKPILLMGWCIDMAPDNATVLDPFMGSGTTGVACARMGLQFVGIEREERYFQIACRRIEQAYAQPRLFEDAKVGAGDTAQERKKVNELALFAGAGGGILGGHLLGWRTVCAVEFAEYPRRVLLARQRDGLLPAFPIWDDVRTFDGKPWRGRVQVVSGGFPCQDISVAGSGDGLDGERSGLWLEMARIIGEVRPAFAFVENSPALTSRGLGRVLGDLAEMGFDARWGVLGAGHLGAPHLRERAWIVGHAMQGRRAPESIQPEQALSRPWAEAFAGPSIRKDYAALRGGWEAEPAVGRVVDGLADGMDRIAALGNGQVPRVAAAAFAILAEQLMTANVGAKR